MDLSLNVSHYEEAIYTIITFNDCYKHVTN